MTSRESRSQAQPGGKIQCQLDYNQQHYPIDISIPDLVDAEQELGKFNQWMQGFAQQNDSLLMQISELAYAVPFNNESLQVPDISALKSLCEKNRNSSPHNDKPCRECEKKDELIEIIQE